MENRPALTARKVLMVTGSYPPMMCGVGDYTAELVDQLRLRGVDVRVLTTASHQTDIEGKNWIKRIIPEWTFPNYRLFLDEVRSFAPDIVHIQDPTQGYDYATSPMLMVLLSRLLHPMSIIWTWHEHPPAKLNKRYAMHILMSLLSKAIIVVRPTYKDHVNWLLSLFLFKKPFELIPNASIIPKITLAPQEIENARNDICGAGKKIIVYFGFIYPNKGVERLFEILDPETHHLVLVGHINPNDPYHQTINQLAAQPAWAGNVTCTGFVSPKEAGRYIKIADAVILPYVEGGGTWNTSLHAATLQGTFVITTSTIEAGYKADENIFYARPDDISAMSDALTIYCGTKKDVSMIDDPWNKIADDHLHIYSQFSISKNTKDIT